MNVDNNMVEGRRAIPGKCRNIYTPHVTRVSNRKLGGTVSQKTQQLAATNNLKQVPGFHPIDVATQVHTNQGL